MTERTTSFWGPTPKGDLCDHPAARRLLYCITSFFANAGPEGPIPELRELVVDLRHHQKAAIHWMLGIEQVAWGGRAATSCVLPRRQPLESTKLPLLLAEGTRLVQVLFGKSPLSVFPGQDGGAPANTWSVRGPVPRPSSFRHH